MPQDSVVKYANRVAKHKDNGLCMDCEEPQFEGHLHCFAHYVRWMLLSRDHRERIGVDVGSLRCSLCKRNTHNKTTHHIWVRAVAEGLVRE